MPSPERKRALYQKLPLTRGNSFVIGRYVSPYFETPWHFQEEYELVYCEHSFGSKFIGISFSDYQAGEMALIGKNVPHLFRADNSFYESDATTKTSSIVIQFTENFLGKSFFSSPEMTEMKNVLSLTMNGLKISGETNKKIRSVIYHMQCYNDFR